VPFWDQTYDNGKDQKISRRKMMIEMAKSACYSEADL
jgi:hypothetical protein